MRQVQYDVPQEESGLAEEKGEDYQQIFKISKNAPSKQAVIPEKERAHQTETASKSVP